MNVSIIVPIFNSSQIAAELVERLEPVLRQEAEVFELVLINDGSRDDSWNVIVSLARQHPWIRCIDLMRNYGQHSALLCGIRAARYEIIVTMDDDLQHPPEMVPQLLTKLSEGYDVVYGVPNQQAHGMWRGLASQITKLALQNAMGAQEARNVSAFRAFRTVLRNSFAEYRGSTPSIDALLTWGTTRFSSVRVRHDPRHAGVSNYTLRQLVRHALNMITGFSTVPLRVASIVGFGFTLAGLAVLVYVLVRYIIEGGSVPGFPFLASIIAIFSGAQLFALGVIGEYLARMHNRMMDHPTYSVRSTSDDWTAEGK